MTTLKPPRPSGLIRAGAARTGATPSNHKPTDGPLTRADITDAATRYYAELPKRNTRPRRPGQGFATWASADIYLTVTTSPTGLWVRYSQVTGGQHAWDRWRLPEESARSGHVLWKRVETEAAKAATPTAPADDSQQLDLLGEVAS